MGLDVNARIKATHNNITASGVRISKDQELVLGRDITVRDGNQLINSRGAVEIIIREPKNKQHGRLYSGAANVELLAGWRTSSTTANQELYSSLEVLRDRCNSLMRNSALANKIKRLYVDNIVGKNGIVLQAKTKSNRGVLDDKANKKIEAAMTEWSSRKNCTVSKNLSNRKVQELIISSLLTAGEIFIRKVTGRVNSFGYAWQIITPELIPLNLNTEKPDGTTTIMGIDYDVWGRPTAYNVAKNHNTAIHSAVSGSSYARDYMQIPSDEIIHIFNCTRAGMTRGEPILSCVIEEIKMIDTALDSTLLEVIVNSKKMGFIETAPESRQEIAGRDLISDGDDGFVYSDRLQTGTIDRLPPGAVFKSHAPNTPAGTLPPFIEWMLKVVASGVDVPFVDLANSYDGMNYSTSKSQATKAKESWKSKQKDFLIEPLLIPSYEDEIGWLEQALLTGKLQLNQSLIEKYKDVEFRGRGFSHNDPEKEAKGFSKLISLGVASRTSILYDTTGENFKDIVDELAKEQEYAKMRGVNIAPLEHQTTEDSEDSEDEGAVMEGKDEEINKATT